MLENFRNASTFVDMTLAEKMSATLNVIILGMGITFFALILIWSMIVLMSKIIMRIETKKTNVIIGNLSTSVNEESCDLIDGDDTQLKAVLMAALAMYETNLEGVENEKV